MQRPNVSRVTFNIRLDRKHSNKPTMLFGELLLTLRRLRWQFFLFLTEEGAKVISWGESINDIITNRVVDSRIGN